MAIIIIKISIRLNIIPSDPYQISAAVHTFILSSKLVSFIIQYMHSQNEVENDENNKININK